MTRTTHKSPISIDRRDFIHLAGLGAMGALVLGLDVPVVAQKQPNFIFMLSDDQGWDGLSVQMDDAISGSKSDFYQTPNIEKLAQQGMRFSAAYSPSPVCSPTRCSLQTGKSPAQNRWTKAAPIKTAADGPHSAIVQGDLKLIKFYETDEVRLYDLVNDIGEQNDLSKDMGEKAMHLRERLAQYLESVDAQMPVPNPNYGTNKSSDFNGDGQIDLRDFLEFARAYGSEEARFDLDNSGRVDFADFLKFVQDFGDGGN